MTLFKKSLCTIVCSLAVSCQQEASLGPDLNQNGNSEIGPLGCSQSSQNTTVQALPGQQGGAGDSSTTSTLGQASLANDFGSGTNPAVVNSGLPSCAPGNSPFDNPSSGKKDPDTSTEKVAVDYKELLINPKKLSECHGSGQIYDRESKDCIASSAIEQSWCNEQSAPDKFGASAEALTSALATAKGEGYVIDQCGTKNDKPYLSMYMVVEDPNNVSLKLRAFQPE